MKVKDILPSFQGPTKGIERPGRRAQEVPVRLGAGRAETPPAADRVELNGRAVMAEAQQRIRAFPETREERVEALRREIQAGTYQVEPERVARAMLHDLLKDIY
ncbi:MAG: flagellar biosynthesis anti-sigma factor FlgM [Thermodesulfatator sp.]|nr:MAG: flagellar biosynthesis anti-sigma factor FlgM [Thermodesulfatator sp.]